MAKQRVDVALVARGLAESRTRAQALIMAGLVYVGTKRIDKPGESLAEDAELVVKGRDHPWVSRGGLKLAHGLAHFGFDPAGRVAMDIGASTGGFTDVLLSQGAARVYAVDSGTNQLAWKLRSDPRVVVLEQLSARLLSAVHVPEDIGAIVCDASFISLAKVLEVPLGFAAAGCWLVALVKPQFEAGRPDIGKGGVVRDEGVQARVCAAASTWLAAQPGWQVRGLVESPITGPEGNREWLLGGVFEA